MLSRLPDLGSDARKMVELGRAPYRLASELHEAWLETVGGVSKNRYLAVLEENLELRRRLEAAEARAPSRPPDSADPAAAAARTGEAIDDAFKQIRDAQEQWMSMWIPNPQGKSEKS
jgi:dihydrodipicolinate synthase/N-acetylneuraminate lyase